MNDITIPYNDVLFYGLSMRARDTTDVRGDIFSNILMKYLNSLKPVENRLYRVADNAKYEYNYSFVPTKPISWRVIKNRRVIEDIEQMSDGKYCLNYYDDNGSDVKRVIFNNQHKWQKTNYYNSIYGESLVCSLVPKELNGQTVILQYNTAEPYPITLHCCPMASNSEVMQNVLNRVPEPEVTALTNYGLLYFACEETLKMYTQVLSEEERKYSDANKPKVYNTEDDVAGGFCFDASSFDVTKTDEGIFDLQSVDELTEDGFTDRADVSDDNDTTEPESDDTSVNRLQENTEYSIDKEIVDAIRVISETTNLNINEEIVFSEKERSDEVNVDEIVIVPDDIDVPKEMSLHEVAINSSNIMEESEEDPIVSQEPEFTDNEESSDSGLELLNMDDDAIDDYVSTLIDSILLDVQTTASEYMLDKAVGFVPNSEKEEPVEVKAFKADDYISENAPDFVIESNGSEYFYYGEIDNNNNRTGRGKTLMADGKTAYEGEYADDLRDGVGSFYYKDGSLCYWGHWKKNLRSGFGIGISSETGVSHLGSWEQNKPQGIGVRFDKDGNFMYIDSACHKTNGGIRVVGFTENSLIVEVWDDKSLKTIKKEIFTEDLLN